MAPQTAEMAALFDSPLEFELSDFTSEPLDFEDGLFGDDTLEADLEAAFEADLEAALEEAPEYGSLFGDDEEDLEAPEPEKKAEPAKAAPAPAVQKRQGLCLPSNGRMVTVSNAAPAAPEQQVRAYAGAEVPVQVAGIALAPAQQQSTIPEDLGSGDLEGYFAEHDGLLEEMTAGQPDNWLGLDAADIDLPAEQQAAPAPVPEPDFEITHVKDDIDLAVERGQWGRWDPKGMWGPYYVEMGRQPYDPNNPRDVHDFMQAVIVSLVRRPSFGEGVYTTPAACWWLDEAWLLMCRGLHWHRERLPLLSAGTQQWIPMIWPWVLRGSLMQVGVPVPTLANVNAWRDCQLVCTVLLECMSMVESMQQQQRNDELQIVRETVDLTGQ